MSVYMCARVSLPAPLLVTHCHRCVCFLPFAFVDCLTRVVQKYVRPLYRDLYEYGGEGRAFAIKLFVENRSFYHSIAQKMVARDLQL